ncbi:RNA polymerase sigma factor [Corynebacterium provencense]|nr:sigma-70 family RNA polymerase sigma factor [Corynebacterium provencense]MCI1255819.1 sigma-70 family RNA polymerase sigma factor [Corynebacterium provencense]
MKTVLPGETPHAAGTTAPAGTPGQAGTAGPAAQRTRTTGPRWDYDDLTDAQLLKRHRDGCDRSYGVLVSRHERLLMWTLHRLHIAPEDRADILQEALLKVHRQADSFRGTDCAAAWLRTIVTNTALTHIRSTRRRHEEVDASEDGILDRLRRTPDTRAVDAGRTIQRLLLQDAVRSLRPGLRVTVVLSDVHGLSMEDVSARTGVPVGTVKSRLSRARRQLRSSLSEAGLTPTVARDTVPAVTA